MCIFQLLRVAYIESSDVTTSRATHSDNNILFVYEYGIQTSDMYTLSIRMQTLLESVFIVHEIADSVNIGYSGTVA